MSVTSRRLSDKGDVPMTVRADEGLLELHWSPKEFCKTHGCAESTGLAEIYKSITARRVRTYIL